MKIIKRVLIVIGVIIFWIIVIVGYNGDWIMKVINQGK